MSSQFEEDGIIAELLPQRCGVYVDIGAYHPISDSNTYALYQRGWHGLAIDPLDFSELYRKKSRRFIVVRS